MLKLYNLKNNKDNGKEIWGAIVRNYQSVNSWDYSLEGDEARADELC